MICKYCGVGISGAINKHQSCDKCNGRFKRMTASLGTEKAYFLIMYDLVIDDPETFVKYIKERKPTPRSRKR
jgi:hypothetical protein